MKWFSSESVPYYAIGVILAIDNHYPWNGWEYWVATLLTSGIAFTLKIWEKQHDQPT